MDLCHTGPETTFRNNKNKNIQTFIMLHELIIKNAYNGALNDSVDELFCDIPY